MKKVTFYSSIFMQLLKNFLSNSMRLLKKISFTKFKQKKFIAGILILILLGLLISTWIYKDNFRAFNWGKLVTISSEPKKDLLDVIAIADFSGPTKMIGADLAQGFKDASDAYSISKDVRFLVKDDRGDASAVSALADGAAAGFSTLAVIGPTQINGFADFAQSLEEGMVPGLIPIGPPSTLENNKWTFSLQPSQERQGEFVANIFNTQSFIKKIIFVTTDEDAKSNNYLNGFKKVIEKNPKQKIELKKFNPQSSSEEIKSFLASLHDSDTIVLSLPIDPAVVIVRGLKDIKYAGAIIGFGGAGLSTFPNKFKDLPSEVQYPGYYTNGLIGVTPFVPSMAGEKAGQLIKSYQEKTGHEPTSAYAYGYDTGVVLAQFINKLKLENPNWKDLPPEDVREGFKKFLTSMKQAELRASGYTGSIKFDQNNERDIPPTLVVFNNGFQKPYFLQYGTENARLDFSTDANSNQIQVNNRIYDLVPVVFTGIKVRNINEIDIDKREFHADFDIWFRSNMTINSDDIVFDNLARDALKVEKVEDVTLKSEKYSLYRFTGNFHFNASSKDLILGKLKLPIEWRHKFLDSSRLRFVVDDASNEKIKDKSLVLPSLGYEIESSTLAIENVRVDSLGNPSSSSFSRNFSEPQMQMALTSSGAHFGSFIANTFSWINLLITSSLILLLTIFINIRGTALKLSTKTRLLITLSLGCFALFIGQIGAFASPYLDSLESGTLLFIQNTFIGLYFFIIATVFSLLASWKIDQSKSQNSALQGTFKIFSSGLIYLIFFSIYYTDTLKKDILPVLATSSVALTVVGLAMREIILDALGGITLGVDSAVKVGDWIHIKTGQQNLYGKIEQLGWRNVRIHSRDDMVHFIPNSILLKYVLSNASLKGGFTRFDVKFEINASSNLESVISEVSEGVSNLLAHNEYVDQTKPIRIVCEEVNSNGAKMIAQMYYRADQSRDNLKTKVLEVVNELLRKANASPAMSVHFTNKDSS